MASQDQYKDISKALAQLISDLLATGNWDASLFLRTAAQKLQKIQSDAEALAKRFEKKIVPEGELVHQNKLKQGYIIVYISVYQSDPYNLSKWETTLKSIREYSITRPIYRSQDHVAEAIRSKQGTNEGFVSIYIKENDIIPPYAGKTIQDRWGHELLTIREGCLLPENIIEFVHVGRRYSFKNGKLLLKSDITQ